MNSKYLYDLKTFIKMMKFQFVIKEIIYGYQ